MRLESVDWLGGSLQRVSWTSTGTVADVKILLFKDATFLGQAKRHYLDALARKVPNKGVHDVLVPRGLSPGSDYQLEVCSGANDAVATRSAKFSIDVGKTPPAIDGVCLHQSIWHGGSHQRIAWTSVGEVAKVRLALYKGKDYLTSLARNVANTWSHSVIVPPGLTPGNDYYIAVKSSANNDCSAKSGAFTIDDDHRERCVRIATLLLGLPLHLRLPYPILRKVVMSAATEQE